MCAAIVSDDGLVYQNAYGAENDSVFDVASITKLGATTLAVAVLVAQSKVELDAPLSRWLPSFGVRGKDRVTVRELLGHRSGLPAWSPFFVSAMNDSEARAIYDRFDPSHHAWARAREIVLEGVFDSTLREPGTRVYSDLGFIALGALIETVSAMPLDAFVRANVLVPLALERDVGFVDLTAKQRGWIDGRHVLATGRTRPREPAPGQETLYRVPPQEERDDAGRVDDDNAFAMGGIAGHAGLFGTAPALARLGFALIEERQGAARLGIGAMLQSFVALDPADGPPRSLGFDRPAPVGSSAGERIGKAGPLGAIGHLGFTGCSLFVDLDRRASIALLTNRTFRGRDRVAGIRALRVDFHDAVCDVLDGRD